MIGRGIRLCGTAFILWFRFRNRCCINQDNVQSKYKREERLLCTPHRNCSCRFLRRNSSPDFLILVGPTNDLDPTGTMELRKLTCVPFVVLTIDYIYEKVAIFHNL